jgi:YfiH family protein
VEQRLAQSRHAKEHSVCAFHSTLLDRHGFRHAFATRSGGVSAAPYDTLNLGFHLGDDGDAVRENRTRFAKSLGLGRDRLFEQRQVHGTHVREISTLDTAESVADMEGDALITRSEGFAVAARTADCVPVLIAHPSSGDAGAVHAGWRGAVAGIVSRAIEALSHSPAELVVAIGPHIRVEVFEIGEEVAREMEHAANGRLIVQRDGAKPHGDLAALIRLQLRDAGVPDEAIDDVGGCTHSDAAHFFSHRRERGKTGRHLSAIVGRAPR